MKTTLNAFALSAALALGLMAGSLGQAEAGIAVRDAPAAAQAQKTASVIDVQYRDHRRHERRHYRRHHRHYRGGNGFYFGFGTPYNYRPYYANPPVYVRPRYVRPAYRGMSRAHVNWCYNRYRSYRASDNTFQPYNGPRRQCYSPY